MIIVGLGLGSLPLTGALFLVAFDWPLGTAANVLSDL